MVLSVGFLLRGSNQCALVLVSFFFVAPVTLLSFQLGSTLSCQPGFGRFRDQVSPDGTACRPTEGAASGAHRHLVLPLTDLSCIDTQIL